MARLPLRVFGLFLLTVSLSVASCQAFVHTLTDPAKAQPIEHYERAAD